jgi:hypothetical protein
MRKKQIVIKVHAAAGAGKSAIADLIQETLIAAGVQSENVTRTQSHYPEPINPLGCIPEIPPSVFSQLDVVIHEHHAVLQPSGVFTYFEELKADDRPPTDPTLYNSAVAEDEDGLCQRKAERIARLIQLIPDEQRGLVLQKLHSLIY